MTDENNQTRKALLVGDSPKIQEYLDIMLESGFDVEVKVDAENARRYLSSSGLPHIMIVDADLSDMSGIDFCAERHDLSGLPIIIITTRADSKANPVEALKYADDFVAAPFETEELVMRVRRILSRINDFSYASGPRIQVNDWLIVDPVQRQINVHGEVKKLTPIENALLHVLLKHRGKVVDADTLIERVWRSDPTASDRNVLRVHIHRLRQKLEGDDSVSPIIVTERGIGYAFVGAQ